MGNSGLIRVLLDLNQVHITQVTKLGTLLLLSYFTALIAYWLLDSNRGPVVSEATALPTEPQPLPKATTTALWSFVDIDVTSSV